MFCKDLADLIAVHIDVALYGPQTLEHISRRAKGKDFAARTPFGVPRRDVPRVVLVDREAVFYGAPAGIPVDSAPFL